MMLGCITFYQCIKQALDYAKPARAQSVVITNIETQLCLVPQSRGKTKVDDYEHRHFATNCSQSDIDVDFEGTIFFYVNL